MLGILYGNYWKNLVSILFFISLPLSVLFLMMHFQHSALPLVNDAVTVVFHYCTSND